MCCTLTQGFGKQKEKNLDREQSTALFAQVSQLMSECKLVLHFYVVSTDNSFPMVTTNEGAQNFIITQHTKVIIKVKRYSVPVTGLTGLEGE
jgi:hypothetical protein